MENDIFYKRPGTTDKGKDYENLNVANMILKLITDEGTKNFKISSNDESYGDFDDIVLEMESSNGGNERYAMQSKHVNKGKTLTKSGLTDDKGNFSIKKYFKNHKPTTATAAPYKMILFTNLKFDVPDGEQIRLSGEDFKIKILKCQPEPFLNTSDNHGRCYKFQVDEDDSVQDARKVREYTQFFNWFYLYTDQANVEKLKKSVLNKFKEMFCCGEGVCGKYLEFVADWSIREGKKEKLNKSQMKRAIAIRVLSQFIEPYTCSIVNDKTKLIRKAISQFAVTVFEQSLIEDVKKIYGDFETELVETKDMDVIRQKFQLSSDKIDDVNNLSDDQSTKLLWLMNKCPLIVVESEATLKIIQLCDDARFILLEKDRFKEKLSNVSIFRNLSDLDNELEMIEKICSTFKCSLQGREEVSLKFLIDQNEDIRRIVTTNELLQMTKDSFVVGEPLETLPIPHVERFLSTNIIDYKYLNEMNENHLVAISCMEKLDQIKIHLSNFDVIKINEYLQGHNVKQNSSLYQSESSKVFKNPIYISEDECSPNDFDEICDKNKTVTICHHFRINHDAKLEWVASKGKDSDLTKYRSHNDFVEEPCWPKYKFDNKINVICADAGMGKSVFMKNLKNKLSSKFWTIIIYPKDISSYFFGTNRQANGFVEYILNKACASYEGFALNLLEIIKRNNQIAYLWDGLDEISDQNLNRVLDIIDGMSKRECKQWITSRSHLRNKLENRLNVLSRNLKEFDDEQQTMYIQRRLVQNCSKSDMQDITLKIKRNIAIAHHNEILGIPLQIFMFTELFRQNPDQYTSLVNNVFSIADLYYHYVDGKFNFHYKGKARLDDSDDLQKQILAELKTKRLGNYERAALKAHFDEEILKELNINCEDFLEDIQSKSDLLGIIAEISEHKIPIFVHNSYGEYFAATYFVKNYKNISKFKKLIFDQKYINIRFLFDLLLARNCPAHIAVLYRNLEVLQNNKDLLNCKDGGGRNLLQLACSWGERYHLLNTVRSDDTVYLVDGDIGKSVAKESVEYQTILEFLIFEIGCNSQQTDEIFKMDSLSYADNALCLLPFVLLSKKQNINFKYLENFNDLCTVLYYSVKFDYSNMLDLIPEIPYIETKREGYSLTHLSGLYSSLTCLQNIFTIAKYRKMINKRDSRGRTTVYVACFMGHVAMVRLLIELGADINICRNDGFSPIYVACQQKHCEIVKLLVESGADINSHDKNGATTTYIACQNRHVEMVRLLIELGADINICRNDGFSPIYLACENGHCEIVKLLVESGADINSRNKNDATTTYIACQYGHVEVVRLLTELGADINIGTNEGVCPIYIACEKGHWEIVKLLVESGADINSLNKNNATTTYVACQNGHVDVVRLLIELGADISIGGFSPIFGACSSGHCEIVKLLVESGADINSPNEINATTTYVACQNGHVEVVHLLIELGADISIGVNGGFSPIFVACSKGHCEIVKLLVEYGADINSANKNGATPTFIACLNGHVEVVRSLIELGADINICRNDGFSPIYVACQNRHCEIIKLLVESGADVNSANRDDTPIYDACERGHVEVVRLLIKLGADINVCDKDGFSAIYVACDEGHFEIVKLLVESGADINNCNNNGCSLIHKACELGHIETVNLLIAAGAHCEILAKDGSSPISIAFEMGHLEIVKLLINSRVSKTSASHVKT